jgi:hypothetical protein
MEFAIEVGENEKTRVAFSRSWWTGAVRITANDRVVAGRSPWRFSTHFSLNRLTRFEFTVGERERHHVVVEHERPRAFGGMGNQKFKVYVDDPLVQEYDEDSQETPF